MNCTVCQTLMFQAPTESWLLRAHSIRAERQYMVEFGTAWKDGTRIFPELFQDVGSKSKKRSIHRMNAPHGGASGGGAQEQMLRGLRRHAPPRRRLPGPGEEVGRTPTLQVAVAGCSKRTAGPWGCDRMARTMTMTSLDMEPLPSMILSSLPPHQQRWEASTHFMEGRDGLEKQDFLWLQRRLEFGDKNFNHTGKDSTQLSHTALPSPSLGQLSLQRELWGCPRANHTQGWKTSSVGWGCHVLRTAPPLSPLGSAMSHTLLRPTLGNVLSGEHCSSSEAHVFHFSGSFPPERDTVAGSTYQYLSRNTEKYLEIRGWRASERLFLWRKMSEGVPILLSWARAWLELVPSTP